MPDSPPLPLAVDLDGTLVKGDLMQEAAVALIIRNPLTIFRLLLWLLRGRAYLKAQIAEQAPLPPAENLAYNQELLAYLKQQHTQRRPLLLATAAHRRHAEAVARHLGIFQTVLATEGDVNMKGSRKAEELVRVCGDKKFDYAGDSAADIAVWQRAHQPILVNASAAVARRYPQAQQFDRPPPLRTVWCKALRPHHWMKNLLLFTVVFSGHQLLSPPVMLAAALGFIVFNLLASATYLINDIVDLPFDRRHSKKCNRPLAAGHISIVASVSVAAALYTAAIVLAHWLPSAFTHIALLYVVATFAYSFKLKRLLLIDVLVLALLFTLRVVAGALATDIHISFWLLAFAVFIFLSLAILKRTSELLNTSAPEAGRAYQSGDTASMAMLGISAGMVAMFVLALFIDSNTALQRYSQPHYIWLAVPLMLYWISRLWILGARGVIGGDPLLYAVRDRASWLVGGLLLLLLYLAK